MPPVVSIVGKSGSGKTTLIEKLLRVLVARGYRVATVKHVPRHLEFDRPDKDSWRHIQAGSRATAISADDQVLIIKPVAQTPTLDQIAHHIGEDYDIIIAEGFKTGGAPKIEVHRREIGPPLARVSKLVAIATDEPLDTEFRQLPLDDIQRLADFLEQDFITPR